MAWSGFISSPSSSFGPLTFTLPSCRYTAISLSSCADTVNSVPRTVISRSRAFTTNGLSGFFSTSKNPSPSRVTVRFLPLSPFEYERVLPLLSHTLDPSGRTKDAFASSEEASLTSGVRSEKNWKSAMKAKNTAAAEDIHRAAPRLRSERLRAASKAEASSKTELTVLTGPPSPEDSCTDSFQIDSKASFFSWKDSVSSIHFSNDSRTCSGTSFCR